MLEPILRHAIQQRASDVHLLVGQKPLFRINTSVAPSNLPALTPQDLEQVIRQMLTEEQWARFNTKRDLDFAHSIPNLGRFRINAHFQRNTLALAIRIIGNTVRPLSQLSLPEVVSRLTYLARGLVLVTGSTGSGKSTTLAGMIDAINRREQGHIVTLEDPIEYLFTGDQCAIEQREVGADVPDFASGLRHVLRQDPDVILVGEMRDPETTRAAITAAETGHLVFSTMHTRSAPQTVERIIDSYPASEQGHIRSMLAGALQAVISQTLLPRADGSGMVAAIEIMICSPAVRTCIRENRVFEIPNILETSRAVGMQTLDSAIRQLFANRLITRDSAISHAVHPENLELSLVA